MKSHSTLLCKLSFTVLLFFGISQKLFSQTLDQNGQSGSFGSNLLVNATNGGQSFKAGLTGQLSSIEFHINYSASPSVAGVFTLSIYNGIGTGGALVGTQNFNVTNTTGQTGSLFSINLTTVISMVAGNDYTFTLSSPTGQLCLFTGLNGYANGTLFSNSIADASRDIWFKTFVSTTATHLNFDGVNDFVSVGTILTPSYTKEAWVYVTNLGLPNNFISGGDGDGQHAFWAPPGFGNRLSSGHNGTWDYVQDATPIASNTWTHVAVTYDAPTTTMKLYKNGVLVSTNTAVPAYTAGNIVRIGAHNIAANLFQGNMDEVRIWNTAQSASEILRRMNCELLGNESGLIAYYKFNQGVPTGSNTSLTTLNNAVSGGTNGTLTNFALTGTTSNWLSGSPVTTGSSIPAAPTTSAQSFCSSTTVASLIPAPLSNRRWFNVATGGTALVSTTAITTSGTYYVDTVNAAGCVSARTSVSVTINTIPSAPTAAAQSFCGSTTVASLVPAPLTNRRWFNVSSGGTALVSTTAITTSGTYYVDTVSAAGCISATRTSVSVTINTIPTVNTPPNQTVCNNTATAPVYFSGNLSGTLCATATEGSNLVLTAPMGTVINGITFASYGTPTGTCGSFAIGTCHASNSLSVVSSLAIGQNSVSIPAVNSTFGDPCGGTPKWLYVEATYTSVVYNWVNNNTSIGLAASGTGIIPSFTAVNPTTVAAIATVTVTPSYTNAGNTCSGTPQLFTIAVNAGSSDAMVMANTTQVLNITTNTFFSANCINLIARVNPNGASPISGNTTAKVWIEGTQPAQYVKRHYEITPTTNATTATGRITLYFTQQEFNDFNAASSVDLPTGAADATGISRLRIEKYPGVSSDGSGLPATYTGSAILIDPADSAIVWNTTASRWEVTFEVTGFSGFFVKTSGGTLPVKWIGVNASLNTNKQAVINWTVQEFSVAKYELEKSIDGSNFSSIGVLSSKGDGTNSYMLTEQVSLQGKAYYRVKQTDKDGKVSYSIILNLSVQNAESLTIYPCPFKNGFTIGSSKATVANITNAQGQVVQKLSIIAGSQYVDAGKLASGMYMLQTANGVVLKIFKE